MSRGTSNQRIWIFCWKDSSNPTRELTFQVWNSWMFTKNKTCGNLKPRIFQRLQLPFCTTAFDSIYSWYFLRLSLHDWYFTKLVGLLLSSLTLLTLLFKITLRSPNFYLTKCIFADRTQFRIDSLEKTHDYEPWAI